ncbi:NACHT, LRR and PYD domains-containing protein 12-like [Puntigrus tetrazona]|uniref:NACHT, LRR and PYD domains-containing protein 12-like n=1 Tax=Puntigrus tetrazona TaxID=1606681 RepID=UPI001C8AE69A|nr:NACHT, LRR and PYD domains-containing protein 12-like [Puntigrus tetrazona]
MDSLLQSESALKHQTSDNEVPQDLNVELKGDRASEDRQERPDSPVASCMSMSSDTSMDLPFAYFKCDSNPGHRQKTSDSERLTCASLKSNASKDQGVEFKGRGTSGDGQERLDPALPSCVSMGRDTINYPNSKHRLIRQPRMVSGVSISECDLPESTFTQCRIQFQMKLMRKFQFLHEGREPKGSPTLLNEIYTELYITDAKESTQECEIRQIETAAMKAVTEDRLSINCNDIFKPLPEQKHRIRTVMTKGFAGIGKTVSVQKFILDWTEGKSNPDVHFIFPLPFRELNLINDKNLSLLDLLHVFFPETKEVDIFSDEYTVLFIFDGLDECRFPLNFPSNEILQDSTKVTSVDMLLTNLIAGNLFPSALIWITSRPAAVDLIPSECVHRLTEVRGFDDPQKVQYFRKRIRDDNLAEKIISHLKSSRSLFIMCHIPVFCWISAAVLEKMLSQAESGEIPKTLTQMFTHFLIIQIKIKYKKDYEKTETDEEMILKLGRLAFQQLVKHNAIFYEEDLRECGIDVTEASVYTGLCTQIFREEFGLHSRKIYCFVHLSIQEHLAAMYVHHTFTTQNVNVFDQITEPSREATSRQIFDLHQRAIDETLQNKNTHLGLFLRFLLGFSLEPNQTLLKVLLSQTETRYHNLEKTIEYIKKMIEHHPTPNKFISLFHCLKDLGDRSLVKQIECYLNQRALTTAKLTPLQWSAVVFVLLTSEHLDVFELKAYAWRTGCAKMVQVLSYLVPVIKAYKSVRLNGCGITDEGCSALASALISNPSHLLELDLSFNELGDRGIKCLSDGLKNGLCKVEKLKLKKCGITDEGCAALDSALKSNPSHLRELELTTNNVGDLGVNWLSIALKNPECLLKILRLTGCGITHKGCDALASALKSNLSQLKELNLANNVIGDSGLKLLSAALADLRCKLQTLGLNDCGIKNEGCAALASALRSNPSHLIELDLSGNKVGDFGVQILSTALEMTYCKLGKLKLVNCGITDEGCSALATALTSNPSHLRELDLSGNKVQDSGVQMLSSGLENYYCQLETLRLMSCGITDESCAALSSALTSNPSHLRQLDLSKNKLSDSGINLLSTGLSNPRCKVEKLRLQDCDATDEGCVALASALRSNPSHLKELDLSDNKLGDLGVNLLSTGLDYCKLEILKLKHCGVTYEGCAALAALLRSNLKYVDLSANILEDLGVQLLSALSY